MLRRIGLAVVAGTSDGGATSVGRPEPGRAFADADDGDDDDVNADAAADADADAGVRCRNDLREEDFLRARAEDDVGALHAWRRSFLIKHFRCSRSPALAPVPVPAPAPVHVSAAETEL